MKVVTGATLLVRGNFTHTLGKIDGSWEVRGNVAFNSTANGPATLIMSGTNAQTLSRTGTEPTGTITVNKSALGVTLTTALNFNSAGQSFNITSGTLNMAGFNLTLNALVLSPTTSISRIAGTLTVSGSPVGAGPYSGGTISN